MSMLEMELIFGVLEAALVDCSLIVEVHVLQVI
jgi:hypothetical protein